MRKPNVMTFENRFGTKVTITLDPAARMTIELSIDSEEGKGTIVLEESGYGWGLCFPELFGGNPRNPLSYSRIALLDLYYNSPAHKENLDGAPDEKPPFQIIVDSPRQTDDPFAHVQFFPEGTKIVTDPGMAQIEGKYVNPFGKEYTITVDDERVYSEEE